jgi:SNF2 family DNA or RNA helicase
MGLGKTLMTLCACEFSRKKLPYHRPTLVIAPLSTLTQWIKETQWFNAVRVTNFRSVSFIKQTANVHTFREKDLEFCVYQIQIPLQLS